MPKTPPYDRESEQALLAALMLERNIFKQVNVSIDDFYEDRHKKIYQIIAEICEEGLEPEYVLVHAKVKAHGWADIIERNYLFALCDEMPSAITKNWKNYVSTIKKKSAARMAKQVAEQLIKASSNGLNGFEQKVETIISQLIEIKKKAKNESAGLTQQIRDWVMITSGNFMITDVYNNMGVITRDNKMKVATILKRLENEGLIVGCGNKNGCYRYIEKDAPLIDYLNVNLNDPYPIKWPFRLEELVDIYPGNVVVVAGAANAGKTAFMLNVVRQNMYRMKIEYFSSEMGPEEMHLRLRKFDDIDLKDWRFSPRVRSAKFADAVVPDALNIIDYLEVTRDFYEVGGEIKDIFDRLNKGIAIIALQKKTGSDYGRGGEFTMEKPRLYLSIESGKLRIVKGKNWHSDVNPNNMEWEFKLVNGCKFLEVGGSEWRLS